MLNPDLHLNEKIFSDTPEMAATRDGYGEGLVELGSKNPNVIVLTADLLESTRNEKFAAKFPDRVIECGVAEQNMAAIAAGLGVSGKIPFISSYATFSPGKNWETIRTTIVYNQSNVKIAGHHSGIMTGADGATHQATEDIAITRCWPDITVVVPVDSVEAKKATIAAAEINTPVYLRFTRDKSPIFTTDSTPFGFGKLQTFWTNDKPQVTIFAIGHLMAEALAAANDLKGEIEVEVVNAASVKPVDEKDVVAAAEKSGAVVTVEDHQVMGGMGSMIAEILGKNKPLPIEFIGLQNTFAESGKPSELIVKYKLGRDAIKEAVRKVIARKNG